MRLEREAVMVSLAPGPDWGGGLRQPGVAQLSGRNDDRDLDREDLEGRGEGDKWRLLQGREDEDRREVNWLNEESVSTLEEKREAERERIEDKKRGRFISRDMSIQLKAGLALSSHTFVVGFALTTKKTKSFIQPNFESLARKHGISFVRIERSRPLESQGPFDAILQKISAKEWQQDLEAYRRSHPDVIILDPPECIQHVRNRQSMLQKVAELDLQDCGGKVDIPKQIVVTGDPTSFAGSVAAAGLKLPLVAKPLVADGTAKSHAMSLAYNEICLSELEPPLVLQEFVNHGGVLFKVYIVGDANSVVRRFSLPDVDGCQHVDCGMMPFPRISSAAATANETDFEPRAAELPPQKMLDRLSRELRQKLGLRLFNLDIIREGGIGDQYYVIDINYFPGYGKVPDYESLFTKFFVSLASSKGKNVQNISTCNTEAHATRK
ncbi:hypothetical protein O6H91_19G068900 [Diphasiastrum complanatum]|uniref:Uncharacterized protein n=3 Tax=Diphasiastrum complanatum TaxID=34168 RepID=A0ACC2AWA4_DIPCM|nr:hypothetical protein O6H91_19G068900 [Diphasiastrum complanatum]